MALNCTRWRELYRPNASRQPTTMALKATPRGQRGPNSSSAGSSPMPTSKRMDAAAYSARKASAASMNASSATDAGTNCPRSRTRMKDARPRQQRIPGTLHDRVKRNCKRRCDPHATRAALQEPICLNPTTAVMAEATGAAPLGSRAQVIVPAIQRRQQEPPEHLHAAQVATHLTQMALVIAALPSSGQEVIGNHLTFHRSLHGVAKMYQSQGNLAADCRIESHTDVVLVGTLAYVVEHRDHLTGDA